MRYRLRVAVTEADLGRRVSVRFRPDDGGFSDVVGVLETCTAEAFGIRDRRGELRIVERGRVVAARVVAPAGTKERGRD